MVPPRALRSSIGMTVAVCLAASGCSAVRTIADGLSDEAPPGVTRAPDSPLGASSSDLAGASLGDAIRAVRGDEARASGAVSSAYVVSPALTWGALQLHRPHALTGFLYGPNPRRGVDCRAEGWAPFELTAQPNRSFAQEVVQNEHVPFGVRSSFMPIGSVFSLDRDVMADHMMRSGAFLVQRGPVCFESLFISVHWTLGGPSRPSGAEAYW